MNESRERTFVLAFFVFRDSLVTTLQAHLTLRLSSTSYTRANPPYVVDMSRGLHYSSRERTSPSSPTLTNSNTRCLSVITRGGEGGVTLAFCRGSGGEEGFAGCSWGFGGGVPGTCCRTCWTGLTLGAAVLVSG